MQKKIVSVDKHVRNEKIMYWSSVKVNSGLCLNSKSFNYWYFFGHLDHSECVFDCNVALKEKLKQFHILLDDR